MASSSDFPDPGSPRTLAAAQLPRRVRRILERALGLFSEDVERHLVTAIGEYEEELFRFAERGTATSGGRIDYLQTLRAVRMSRHDLVPRFMQLIEAGVASIRRPPVAAPTVVPAAPVNFRNLSLVDQSVMDEGTVLHEIAARQESRSNLVLHLLGQRFGVLGAAPAFDGERNPLGPQAMCRAMRHASDTLQLEQEARLLFYRIFDRRVMSQCAALFEKLDALLVEEGVLPSLTYVPMRTRSAATDEPTAAGDAQEPPRPPSAMRGAPPPAPSPSGRPGGHAQAGGGMLDGAAQARGGWYGDDAAGSHGDLQAGLFGGSTGEGPRDTGLPGVSAHDGNRPHTNWMGQPIPFAADIDEHKAYLDLQRLLVNRRAEQEREHPVPPSQRAEHTIGTQDVLSALSRLELDPAPGGAPPSIHEIRQSLLVQARQQHGKAVALTPSDNDTFDLLGLLFNHLQQEIRGDAPAATLVRRMQNTLLRVALQDRAFFIRPNHPARQLLSTVSETAAKWLADDDFDPQMLAPLQQAVTHVVKHYDGNVEVFEQSNRELQSHVDAQVRRAESMERRHVEAARGKEKLEAAKLRAEAALAAELGDTALPKFNRALLNQAWADVLTLTHLRHGEGSEEWNRHIEATRQIVDACTGRAGDAENPALKTQVETALKQVGYHDEEADIIARRLSSNVRDDEDGESRTELTMKLKARVRLGEDAQKARKPDLPPRTPEEQECYDHLRLLPFGTWLEFVTNQQGDVVRRRMSWFSPVTGNALFVNQRGQRVGEHSLDSLARMMAKDQLRVVVAQRARLVDRAWGAAMNALRSIAGRRDEHADERDDGDALDGDVAVRSAPAAPLDDPQRYAATAVRSSSAPDARGASSSDSTPQGHDA